MGDFQELAVALPPLTLGNGSNDFRELTASVPRLALRDCLSGFQELTTSFLRLALRDCLSGFQESVCLSIGLTVVADRWHGIMADSYQELIDCCSVLRQSV